MIIPAATNWVKVNLDNTGFYRVKYSSVLRAGLVEQLTNNHSVGHPFYTRTSYSLASEIKHENITLGVKTITDRIQEHIRINLEME